jgi:hypothetical protein
VGALHNSNLLMRPLGAARDITSNSDWQSYIHQALEQAAVVIVILGSSPGVQWELLTIVEGGHVSKLILVFPPWRFKILDFAKELIPSIAPLLEDWKMPMVAFSDASGCWHLVTSNDQSEFDYEEALILALELGGRFASERP